MRQSPSVIGIENAVTDYIYDEGRADTALRDGFLQFLKPENPPRKGENILISTEEFEGKLLAFAARNGLNPIGENDREEAEFVRTRILGAPRTIEAGGALANSFYLMANAQANGRPIVENGVFLTALGDDEAGRVFSKSMEGTIAHPPLAGRTMTAHIIPIDGDRIIVASPSFVDSCDKALDKSLELFKAMDLSQTKMVMLGGYTKYTGHYASFLDVILDKVAAVNQDPNKRPAIVLTAGAQAVAESAELKSALDRASKVSPVIISANTGEFRRLMGMDTKWREPHQPKWAGLEGHPLEKAKERDADYVRDKLAANDAAFTHAYETYCKDKLPPVTFVVTNGKHGVRVVSNQGISQQYVPPRPPHGVVNTVGGGDAFAGGYLLGQAADLPEAQKAQLGFIAAGEVIGRDEARLQTIQNENNSGLPAYLNVQNPAHKALLSNLGKANPVQERRFA